MSTLIATSQKLERVMETKHIFEILSDINVGNNLANLPSGFEILGFFSGQISLDYILNIY